MVIRFREAASLTSQDLGGAGDPIHSMSSAATKVWLQVPRSDRHGLLLLNLDPLRYRLSTSKIYGKASGSSWKTSAVTRPSAATMATPWGTEDFFPDRQTDRIMAFRCRIASR